MRMVAQKQQATPTPQLSPEAQELLKQLHDIQEPAPVGWWPPAPGWWVVAGILLAVLTALFWWRYRRRRLHQQNRYRVEAVRLLQQVDASAAAAPQEINELIKRVAVTTYGRSECGNLTGHAWLDFLRASADIDCPPAAERALLEHLYRADSTDEAGNIALRDFAISWVERHGPIPSTPQPEATAEAGRV